jgi:RNA polymerase sigma-70 factor, ECF subfamily
MAFRMVPPGPSLRAVSPTEERWRSHIRGIQARNAESLASLYDETSRFLYGLALRIAGNPADAEEVILDVYQHVWNHGAAYEEARGSVWTWLAVITRNRAIDRLRQSNTRRAREVPIEIDHDRAGTAAVPETLSILREERKLVRDAMESLKQEQRVAIELAFFQGLSHTEVAEKLGAPLGTIKTRIRVGLRRLKEAMSPGAPVPAGADAK